MCFDFGLLIFLNQKFKNILKCRKDKVTKQHAKLHMHILNLDFYDVMHYGARS